MCVYIYIYMYEACSCPLPAIVLEEGCCHLMQATVSIMESRTLLRIDMGFYMGVILRPLLQPLDRIHVLMADQARGSRY